jgi:hypothetical protein
MSEVKSTLDLVMERTRHLSLSKEEKDQQQRTDFEKRLQGLLLRYGEGAITPNELQERIAALQAEMKITGRKHLLQAIFKRIDPDANNERWLPLLADELPEIQKPLQAILSDHRRQRADLLASADRRLRRQLAEDHGIEGTAVMPNAAKEDQFLEHAARLKSETQSSIDGLLNRRC